VARSLSPRGWGEGSFDVLRNDRRLAEIGNLLRAGEAGPSSSDLIFVDEERGFRGQILAVNIVDEVGER